MSHIRSVKIKVLFLLVVMIQAPSAFAQVNWDSVCEEQKVYDQNTGTYTWKGARGRYFCIQREEKKNIEKKDEQKKKPAEKKEEKTEEEKCSDSETWDSSCGFVNPDSLKPEEAFEFQAKQRDTLIQNMSVRPDDMDSVVSAQKYMNWVINKSMLLADMYSYSAVQNPDLDPNAKHSSSSFAQKLIAARNLDNRKMFWTALKSWDAEVIIFTKESCDFCRQQGNSMEQMMFDSKLNLLEVALEESCVIGYADNCISGEDAISVAERFNIEIVPTTMIFVPDKKTENPADGIWMRVSNGFSTGSVISNRIYSYLNAWYSAAAKGVKNAMDKPDFLGTADMSRKELHNKLNQVVGDSTDEESD